MARLTIENGPTIEVAEGTKLVLAVEDSGVDIMHRCGGNARCTTCRVEIIEGHCEPPTGVELERISRESDWPADRRLSCQVRVETDITIRVISTTTSTGMPAGPRPMD